jgi:hypothetical protein
MRKSEPVMASKPVANTMASNSNSASVVRKPVAVIDSMGVSLMSTRRTLSRLNVS